MKKLVMVTASNSLTLSKGNVCSFSYGVYDGDAEIETKTFYREGLSSQEMHSLIALISLKKAEDLIRSGKASLIQIYSEINVLESKSFIKESRNTQRKSLIKKAIIKKIPFIPNEIKVSRYDQSDERVDFRATKLKILNSLELRKRKEKEGYGDYAR